ncbi:MAG: hypothetical protein JW838_00785 [Spirochaetes bacterium]|nr:hypothetical protein [Spirochaetota bacterium]
MEQGKRKGYFFEIGGQAVRVCFPKNSRGSRRVMVRVAVSEGRGNRAWAAGTGVPFPGMDDDDDEVIIFTKGDFIPY